MPIPEKEFQDEYKQIWARKTELERVIHEFRVHNFSMFGLVILVVVCGLGVLVFLDSIATSLKEIVQLFN